MEEITLVEVKPQLVAGMREQGKYRKIEEMIPKLSGYVASKGAQFVGPPIFICHETTPEQAMEADEKGTADVEIAAPIAAEIEETEEIKYYTLPGGRMVKTLHQGPYEDCGPTYEKLYKWLRENRKQITGPTREYYLNDPLEVPPEEILTEIYMPIG